MVIVLVRVRDDDGLLVALAVRDGAIETELAVLGVVDRADLEAVLVAAHEARAAAAVARGASRHDA
eukprot:3805310-Prymnesium_polylepis.1